MEVVVALTLLAQPVHLRLNTDAIAVPALTSQVRPALVLPERAANLCFGGARRNRLFIAGSQSIYALYVNAQGATLS